MCPAKRLQTPQVMDTSPLGCSVVSRKNMLAVDPFCPLEGGGKPSWIGLIPAHLMNFQADWELQSLEAETMPQAL